MSLAFLAGVAIWAANVALVGSPVSSTLSNDSRNTGYEIHAHYEHYINPNTLVLDLSDASHASALDLFRGIFQSAQALQGRGRTFRTVILANHRKEVFLIDGAKFEELGREFADGENPVYMVRTLPENLLLPDGRPAFSKWEGGILGVLSHQMADAAEAGKAWAEGRAPMPQLNPD